jgi:hypothetical protein
LILAVAGAVVLPSIGISRNGTARKLAIKPDFLTFALMVIYGVPLLKS